MYLRPKTRKIMTTKRIFVSYKRVNRALVDTFLQQLSPEIQDECWMDLTDINYGKDFKTKICKAIDQADAFLFMYSKVHTFLDEDDFAKDWTVRELDYAEASHKKIWFISIDNCNLKGQFQLLYSGYNLVYNAAADIKKLDVELQNWLWQQKTNTRHLIEAYQNMSKSLMAIVDYVAAMAKEDGKTRKCPICGTEQEDLFRQSCSKCKYIFPPLYGIWPDLQLSHAQEQEVAFFRELWERHGTDDSTKSSLGIGNEGNSGLDTKATNLFDIDRSERISLSNLAPETTQIDSSIIAETKEDKELDEGANKVAVPNDDAANAEEPAKESESTEDESKNTAPVAGDIPEDKQEAEKTDEVQEEKTIPSLNFEASFSELNTLLAPPAETTEEQPAEEAPATTEETPAEEAKEETSGLDLTKCNDDLTSMFNLK